MPTNESEALLEEENTCGDETESELQAGSEAGNSGEETDPQNKKKKKRKKKKRKRPAPESSTTAAQSSTASKQELDARFAMALQQLQRNSPECSWTRLDSCNIFDAKTRKVAEALKSNKELTSLDLSSNHIGDAGAQALADALQNGAAPELVFLDLRENPFGSDAVAKLESLQNERRSLRIEVGVFRQMNEKIAPEHSSDPVADPDGREMLEVKSSLAPNDGGGRNGFLQRFFQVGNGGHSTEAPERAGEAEEEEEDPEQASRQCWEQIEELLAAKTVDIPQLSHKLGASLAGICKEMGTSSVPLLNNTKLAELRPYTRHAVQKIPFLVEVLDVPAAAHCTPHSRAKPVPGLGSHCVRVAQIAERLTFGRTAAINTHLVKGAVLPRLFSLSLAFPDNNPIQSACCSALKWALESGLHLMWKPLLSVGLGVPGAVVPAPTLPDELMRILQAAWRAPSVALRACNVGFALNIAAQLRETSGTDSMLQRLLAESRGWAEFAEDEGTLSQLLAEQQGDLCGPRPNRLKPPMDSDGTRELQTDTPDLISGDDLVKLLTQSVRGIHICDSQNFDDDDSDDDSDEEPQDELQRLIEAPVQNVE